MKQQTTLLTALCALLLCVSSMVSAQTDATGHFRQWGQETLHQINASFWLSSRGLYADDVVVGQPAPERPAFMWGCGVQLAALTAAAHLDPASKPQLQRYVKNLDTYWTNEKGIGGYDVLPGPKPTDRYYDDNAWVALDLADAYDLSHDPQTLRRAEETFRFIQSGEDPALGGGIYWRENEHNSKNTCSNAPSAAAALRLYQITRKPEYLADGARLCAWTTAHLQDADGLFFDNIALNGTVEKSKWSYNSALMIRANCLLYAITGTKSYLTEAQRIAHASVAHWVRPETGAMADTGKFAHLLCEALLFLYEQDRDFTWLHTVERALTFVHEQLRDPSGYYGDNWARPQTTSQQKTSLLNQASVARAFLVMARYE